MHVLLYRSERVDSLTFCLVVSLAAVDGHSFGIHRETRFMMLLIRFSEWGGVDRFEAEAIFSLRRRAASLVVRLDVLHHVAHLVRSDVAAETLQHLVGPVRHAVDHKPLREAHVARVGTESVPNAALRDNLAQRATAVFTSSFTFGFGARRRGSYDDRVERRLLGHRQHACGRRRRSGRHRTCNLQSLACIGALGELVKRRSKGQTRLSAPHVALLTFAIAGRMVLALSCRELVVTCAGGRALASS